jgi:hypothetical protein
MTFSRPVGSLLKKKIMRNYTPLQLIVLSLILLVLFSRCSNDEDTVEPQPKKDSVNLPQLMDDLHLSKVYADGKLYREITYDETKKIVSITEYENGEIDGSQLWEYDEKGKVAKKWLTQADGSFQVVYTYEYDGSGNLVKSLVYNELFEAPSYGTTYEYNDNGKISSTYHFLPSQPDKIQTYSRYEYDTDGNLTVQKNYNVESAAPDVLYYEEYLHYDDPQKTAKIREKIGKSLYDIMFLYSSTEVTNYVNDGSGDIGYAYSVEVDIEYDAHGWPTTSNATVAQTHPQYKENTMVLTYDYIRL